MSTTVRAALAVAVLRAYSVLLPVVATALVVLVVLAFGSSPWAGIGVCVPVLPLLVLLARRPRLLDRLAFEEVPGVPVAPREQPGLWGLVHQVCERVGAAPPDGIRVLASASAGVSHRAGLPGLRVTRRELHVGAPLFLCLGEERLARVLARVLAPRDTALVGRDLLVRVLAHPRTRRWYVFRLCAAAYLALVRPLCLRHDRPSGGADLAWVERAWREFVDDHLTPGWAAGYLPTSCVEGFALFWAEHSESADSCTDLLVDPRTLLDEAVRLTMVDEADTKTRVDWLTLGHVAGRHAAVLATARLLDAAGAVMAREGTLGAVLDALDAGRIAELGPPDARPGDRHAGPRALRECVRGPVRADLAALVGLALADHGLARWQLSWSGLRSLVVRPPHGDGLDDLLAAATADRGDTGALRAALADAGVAPDYRPEVH
ncbi:hypothetical protein [Umezawaea tangerina]|uniref:Uncharacterized protein n=1 Tax=Umezawaea tangerina TaxID=84725 RepID=A0A2T0SE28_9PSEU|nr:hypothetical protein [Umezawaea tangerina]PRY31664.1 hypothetical protein CLV43_12270 [Umezawaea tangerina]